MRPQRKTSERVAPPWAADTGGILNGSLSDDGTLELIYQEPGTTDGAAR